LASNIAGRHNTKLAIYRMKFACLRVSNLAPKYKSKMFMSQIININIPKKIIPSDKPAMEKGLKTKACGVIANIPIIISEVYIAVLTSFCIGTPGFMYVNVRGITRYMQKSA
jgi:hypothetical protein